jgi:hypothetical protein
LLVQRIKPIKTTKIAATRELAVAACFEEINKGIERTRRAARVA